MNMQGLIKRMKRMTPPQTPGAKNPSGSARARTTGSGKGVVPVKPNTKNGGKKQKITHLKGGKGTPMPGRIRGGYGAARPNLGFAAATKPIGPVAGSGGTGKR